MNKYNVTEELKNKLPVIPKITATDRQKKRALEQELKRNNKRFHELEVEFFTAMFDESLEVSYSAIYESFLDSWLDLIEWHIRNRKFKKTAPSVDYFKDKYKPIENIKH